jgi:hypothetical protein
LTRKYVQTGKTIGPGKERYSLTDILEKAAVKILRGKSTKLESTFVDKQGKIKNDKKTGEKRGTSQHKTYELML